MYTIQTYISHGGLSIGDGAAVGEIDNDLAIFYIPIAGTITFSNFYGERLGGFVSFTGSESFYFTIPPGTEAETFSFSVSVEPGYHTLNIKADVPESGTNGVSCSMYYESEATQIYNSWEDKPGNWYQYYENDEGYQLVWNYPPDIIYISEE